MAARRWHVASSVSRGVFDLITLTTPRPTASSDELIQRVIQQGENYAKWFLRQTDALKFQRTPYFHLFPRKAGGEKSTMQLCEGASSFLSG